MSFPLVPFRVRTRESSYFKSFVMPAFASMTNKSSFSKLTKIIFAFSLLLFAFSHTGEAADRLVRIGVIDIKKIMKESHAFKKAQAGYLKELETKRAALKTKEQGIQLLEEELKNPAPDLSAEKRTEKDDRLTREIKELKQLAADMDEDLKNRDSELTRKLAGEILDVVKTFQEKEKYTIIMHQSYAVAFEDAADVTDKIITLYNSAQLTPVSDVSGTSAQSILNITGYINARSVNLRSEPTVDSQPLGGYARGTALTIVGEKGDWYRVVIGNHDGYMMKSFVVKGTKTTPRAPNKQ